MIDFLGKHYETFDLITGLDFIEHLHKDEVLRFLDGCYEALKLGGRLILQTSNAESPWVSSIRYGDFTHEACFTPKALTILLNLWIVLIEVREMGPVPWDYSIKSAIRYSM